MPSKTYQHWLTARTAVLDGVEAARHVIGGSPYVRRLTTQIVNRSYVVALSAEFQGYCKDLHRECAAHYASLVPAQLTKVVYLQFLAQRLLDRGNPNPGNIGADFNRLGLKLFDAAAAADPRTVLWRTGLEELNTWRNAIAHNEYDPQRLGGTIRLSVIQVRGWRAACDSLAGLFDRVLGQHLRLTTGTDPW